MNWIFFEYSFFSRVTDSRFKKYLKQPLAFDNSEYEIRISGTVDTDQRIMSFFDILWGFEVTGGSDQFEPLTIIDVRLIYDNWKKKYGNTK